MPSILLECRKVKEKYNYSTKIIADGGIRIPADFCKALALGADFVMMGSVLASSEESPAKTLRINSGLKKVFRGSASFSTQIEYSKRKPEYVEGHETMIDYGGPLEKIIKRFVNGLRSSMSYMNANNLDEYRKNADWCLL